VRHPDVHHGGQSGRCFEGRVERDLQAHAAGDRVDLVRDERNPARKDIFASSQLQIRPLPNAQHGGVGFIDLDLHMNGIQIGETHQHPRRVDLIAGIHRPGQDRSRQRRRDPEIG